MEKFNDDFTKSVKLEDANEMVEQLGQVLDIFQNIINQIRDDVARIEDEDDPVVKLAVYLGQDMEHHGKVIDVALRDMRSSLEQLSDDLEIIGADEDQDAEQPEAVPGK